MIFSHCAMPNDKLYLVTFIIVIMYNDGKKWRVTLICNFVVDSKK